MTKVIYPGSFDPVTNGHLDVAIRSAKSFDEVIIGVMINKKKDYTFTIEERVKLIQENIEECPNIKVVGFEGLMVDFMKKENINTIVKGLRTVTDYEAEFQMALVNKRLFEKAETYFIPTSEKYSLISSSMVKELHSFGGDISDFVPQNVENALIEKYKKET